MQSPSLPTGNSPKKLNNLIAGILSGLLAPVLAFWGYYIFLFGRMRASDFMKLAVQANLLSKIISLSVLINLGLFFLFLRYNHEKAARGILIATFVYAIVVVVLKFM